MISISSDFHEKSNEAEVLLSHIRALSIESRGTVQEISILKSAFMLLLYNIIESTTTSILERIHEKVSVVKYQDSSQKLRLLIVEYHFAKGNAKKYKAEIDKITNGDTTLPLFDVFKKKVSLFSGNLDARELNKLLTRYGIGALTHEDKDKLLIVKNKRNKIAHGEEMFKESCRSFTANELDEICKAVLATLNQLIELTRDFFLHKKYLA